jgi:exosortase/archaeosortase family protein
MQAHQTDMLLPDTDVPVTSPPWLRFALLCTLFLLAAVWLEPHLSTLCRATAAQVSLLLGLVGYMPLVQGDLVQLPGFSVRIVTECTPLYSSLLYAAFVLAQPATWKRTLAGLCAGILVISAANLLRIAFVTAAGTVLAPILFDILHVYLGQVAMLVLVVSACLLWLRWSADGPAPLPFMLRAGLIATILFVPWLMINRDYVAMLDSAVALLFAWLYPGYHLLTPRPLPIYNHTFAVPLLFSLVVAGWKPWTWRRFGALIGGICLIATWHTLFRISHVVWTALNVPEIEPLHQAIYLLGQFLLPFLLWFLLDGRFFRLERARAVSGKPVIIALLLLFCSVTTAFAEPVVMIYPTGRGGFALKADNLNRVSEAEIRIDYKSEVETPPQVNGAGLGAQATITVQNDTPGSITVRLKSSKPLSGNVQLAFAQIQGSVTFMTAWLRDESGMTLTPRSSIKNPSDEDLSAMAERRKKKAAPTAERSAVPVPAFTAAVTVAAGAAPLPSPVTTRSVKRTEEDDTSRTLVFSRHPSVLDAFRTYTGEHTPVAQASLFERSDNMFRQEPPVLLSDGVAALRLTVRIREHTGRAPQFFISGANCNGLHNGDDGTWELELMPESGSLAASVTVMTETEMIEFPLAIAPPQEQFDADRAGMFEAEYVAAANWVVRGNNKP